MQRPIQKPPKKKCTQTFRNSSNSSKIFSTLRSKKPSCLWGRVMQQNICCINHHWDWEHLLQVKTTFLVALQGEIRNSVLQQAGKNKSTWLDGPTLQGFCYFWWDKEQTNNSGTACSGSRLCSGKSAGLRQAVSCLLGKCLENISEPLEQCCETQHQELRTLRLSQAYPSCTGTGSLLLHEDAWREVLAAASLVLQLALSKGL